jgi:hypothetical protein
MLAIASLISAAVVRPLRSTAVTSIATALLVAVAVCVPLTPVFVLVTTT